jgi:ABC-2 type transport system ATP-binding protein
VLELDRLTRRFGDLVALDGLSFSVEPGQMFGFVGSNGAGKTTAMRIMMGVDAPDEGEVRFDGCPIDADMRARFGYMPEERGLYPKTPALRQLTYLGRLHRLDKATAASRASELLDRFGLGDRSHEPVETLSLGNQQRVQLAAALVHEPELLILDEPFSGLDPVGVDALSEILLERAADGVPVVFSSHQLELVERLCDAVAIIDAGKLVASGKVDELRATGGRLLRVEVDAADPVGWADRLPGVSVVASDDTGQVLNLESSVDDQQVLRAAQAVGRVRHFGAFRPTLAELYREAVANNRATTDDGSSA